MRIENNIERIIIFGVETVSLIPGGAGLFIVLGGFVVRKSLTVRQFVVRHVPTWRNCHTTKQLKWWFWHSDVSESGWSIVWCVYRTTKSFCRATITHKVVCRTTNPFRAVFCVCEWIPNSMWRFWTRYVWYGPEVWVLDSVSGFWTRCVGSEPGVWVSFRFDVWVLDSVCGF